MKSCALLANALGGADDVVDRRIAEGHSRRFVDLRSAQVARSQPWRISGTIPALAHAVALRGHRMITSRQKSSSTTIDYS
jgi:hypothetical protein